MLNEPLRLNKMTSLTKNNHLASPFLLYPVITLRGILGYNEGQAHIDLGTPLYCSKPLKPGDLEGRGGREGGLLMALSVLPVDQPSTWEVT